MSIEAVKAALEPLVDRVDRWLDGEDVSIEEAVAGLHSGREALSALEGLSAPAASDAELVEKIREALSDFPVLGGRITATHARAVLSIARESIVEECARVAENFHAPLTVSSSTLVGEAIATKIRVQFKKPFRATRSLKERV